MNTIGIEKIRVYPASLKLDLSALAVTRGYDLKHLHQELMVFERGLNPVWEDSLTMAVNAAIPILSEEDRKSIGLLIVGTETGLDQEKSLSSWVHHYLKLPSSCRHFEIKGACYSGTAAFKMAASWLTSGVARPGQKALVITADQSLNAIHKPWEYVGGAAGVAMLISDQPDFIELEQEKFGIYSHEVSDVIRPLPWIETGNSEHSLFSYMEALGEAYLDYEKNTEVTDFEQYFDYNIYHVPFSGISFRAHKLLMRQSRDFSNDEIINSFNLKTKPSIEVTSKIGASYGGSVYIALLSLIRNATNMTQGKRIGVFSYGSGSCAEYFSVMVNTHSRQIAQESNIEHLLDQRHQVTVEEYEMIENQRVEMSRSENYIPDINLIPNAYTNQYEDQNKLIFKGSKNYYRSYEFS